MKRQPKIFECKPCQVELEAGEHLWCACGLSGHQPFCDFSHKGTGIVPVKFRLNERQVVWLCNCKHTRTPPFCDGSHASLPRLPQEDGA
jgi:CDGSH iron-sulfur domain-containing protein 3